MKSIQRCVLSIDISVNIHIWLLQMVIRVLFKRSLFETKHPRAIVSNERMEIPLPIFKITVLTY